MTPAPRLRHRRGPLGSAASTMAALVLALGLGACGGPDGAALLAGASDALDEAGTARFEMTITAAGDGGGGTFRAEGAQDLAAGSLRMTMDLGDGSRGTETLLIGPDAYLRSPLFAILTGDPDLWVRIDLEAAGAEAGLDTDALLAGNSGPAAMVAQLQGATEDIEELGTADVRGVQTTHLRVIVSTQAAIDDAPASVREQLRVFAEATGLPDAYPMELWISDDGLVRRIRTVVDTTEDPDAEVGVTQETLLELFDFGVSVDLDPPLPERTVDMAELITDLERLEEGLGTGPG